MAYITTIDVDAFRDELAKLMIETTDKAVERRKADPDNAGWSHAIRDAAIVHTLDLVIKALDKSTRNVYEG